MASWKVTHRAKRSPFVVGLQRRRRIKLRDEPITVFLSGDSLVTRKDALREFKKLRPWAVITNLTKVRG